MELLTYRSFRSRSEAEELQDLLLKNKIESILFDNSPSLGAGFGGELLQEFEVKIKAADFEPANEAVEAAVHVEASELPEGYYLLGFSNDELMEVVAHHDEWSDFDYLIARQLLRERGHEVDDKQLQEMAVNRLHELARPEKSQGVWIIIGYGCALAGGLLGLIIGYVLATSNKTLPTGISVPTYSPADRRHGRQILLLSAIILVVLLVLKVYLAVKE